MPRVPKWMADAMQSLFSGMYHPVEVTHVYDIALRLRRVRFEGDLSKSKKTFIPGNVIEFRVSDTEFRHYTPSYFDQQKGVCEVLFYLHDKGPGSKWVADRTVGDRINLLGPGGKIAYDSNATTHLVFGDETSLGLIECIQRESERRGHAFFSIAELDKVNAHWIKELKLEAIVAEKSEKEKARHTTNKLEALLTSNPIQQKGSCFYLTGNAKSIVAVKKFLLGKGFSSKQIQTEPYWAEGKAGL